MCRPLANRLTEREHVELQLAATIRKRNPKHPLLASLNTTIETRIADIKKREEEVAEATKTAAAIEEEKKRTLAAQKEAEDAKAATALVPRR